MISDSMTRYVGPIPGVQRVVQPGAVIEDFTDQIWSGETSVKGMDAILIHVGTNNVANGNCPQHVLTEFGNLIRAIRSRNQLTHIVVSSILPRVCDHRTTHATVKEVNKLMGQVARERKVVFLRTFLSFCSGKERYGIKEYLYAADGLHLNPRGCKVLREAFRVQFSDNNIKQREEAMLQDISLRLTREHNFGD